MTALQRSRMAAIAVLFFASPVAAQVPSPVAVAADADVIAVYSRHAERRLLRVRFDRAAGKIAFAPFGPTGIEIYAVAPKGAFVAYGGILGEYSDAAPHVFLLDEAGRPLGKPVLSPIGPVSGLAVSPQGDRVAAVNARGWIALFAVEGTGPSRRLVARGIFGASAYRPLSFAFRPDGGLATLTDDWVLTFRGKDGQVQRTLDLKSVNRDLAPGGRDENEVFRLIWSPRGDRFAVTHGGGPFATLLFDAAGRRLLPRGAGIDEYPISTGAAFSPAGDALLIYGMAAPIRVHMGTLAGVRFGGEDLFASYMEMLSGGRGIAVIGGDRAALWSDTGTATLPPAGFENYLLGQIAAGGEDEAIVAAERGGWIDLFTRQGKFVRRVQSGARGSFGAVALSADGTRVAAFGEAVLGVFAPPGGRLWGAAHSSEGLQDFFLATAADGSRIAAAGPGNALRSWSRDGGDAAAYELRTSATVPRRLMGLAVSTGGDAIALADEGRAVWLAYPADRRVLRVAMPAAARSIAALPAGAGFAIGLFDGTVLRIGRDGAALGPPLKAAEIGAVGRLAVAPDGLSFIAVEGDEISARHLAWDGRVLAGPVRAHPAQRIKGAFFRGADPVLIVARSKAEPAEGDDFSLADFTASRTWRTRSFDLPPRDSDGPK